jgi:hypothetical protein
MRTTPQRNRTGMVFRALLPVLLAGGLAMPARSASRPEHGMEMGLEGKLLSVPGHGPVLRAHDKDIPLAATSTYLLHTLEDQRLANREVRLEGTMQADGHFEVAHLFTLRDGKLYRVRYYCNVCNIVALEPGRCVCCQRPTELQEIPVSQTDRDTLAN